MKHIPDRTLVVFLSQLNKGGVKDDKVNSKAASS